MKKFFLFSVFLLLTIISFRCSSSEEMRRFIDRQTNPFFLKKAKHVFFSRLEGSHPQIYFGLELARNEFAYIQNDSGFNAKVEIALSVTKEDEFQTVWDTLVTLTKHFTSFDSTRIPAAEKILIPISIPPGEFYLSCIVSEKNASGEIKIHSLFKNNMEEDSLTISSVRFLEDKATSSISFTKQLSRDDIKKPSIDFDVLCHTKRSSFKVRLLLSKIRSDTSAARSLYAFSPMYGSIEARGIKRSEVEWETIVLDSVSTDLDKSLTYSYLIPDTLQEGAYLARVELQSGKVKKVTEPEIFYIFPNYFPNIKTIRDAVEIVKYIASPSENNNFENITDSTLKYYFDEFWLELSGRNKEAARKKIAKFFRRVTEANLLFSNYKPGWKTDLGMIYILSGYPAEVNWITTQMTWFYYSGSSAYLTPFHFKPIRDGDDIIGYLLNRVPHYQYFWEESRKIWERNL